MNPPREDRFELVGVEPPQGARERGNRGRFVASEGQGMREWGAVLPPESGDAGEAFAVLAWPKRPCSGPQTTGESAREHVRIGQCGERVQQRDGGHRHLQAQEIPVAWNTHLVLSDVLVAAGRKPETVLVVEQAIKLANPNETKPKLALEALKK